MRAVLDIIIIVLDLYVWLLIASAILSWLIAFNVVNTRNQFVAAVAEFLYRITEPLLAPIRSALEAVGAGFDNPQGWDVNLRFYALTYGLPVLMANRVGTERDLTFWGGSRILDPFGCVLASAAGRGEELVRAELDFDVVRRARYLLPTVRDANLPLLQREIDRVLSHDTEPPA